MRISTFHVPISPGSEHDTRTIDALIERALLLDAHGLSCVYLPEHHFDDYCPYANNFMLASYLAPQMTQAWLGFSVIVIPLNHPMRMAEQMNLLHQLTKGRVVFGVGSGGIPLESAGFGVDVSSQSKYTIENLEIIEKLWAKSVGDEPVDFATDYFNGKLVQRVMPAAYEAPRILKLACLSSARLQQAADRGWPAFVLPFNYKEYRERLDAAGHSPEVKQRAERWTSIQTQFHVAETDEQAREEALEALLSRQQWVDRQTMLQNRYNQHNTANELPQIRYDSEFGLAMTIHGSPETVIRRVKEMEQIGCAEIVMETDFGIHDTKRLEALERSTRLLAEEVLPHFQDQSVRAPQPYQMRLGKAAATPTRDEKAAAWGSVVTASARA